LIYGLYLSTQGALIQDAKGDVVANNLANVNSAGFKRDVAVFRVRPPEPREDISIESAGPAMLEEIGGGAYIAEVVTLLSQGLLKETGRALDVALDGEGFFVVSDGRERYYTRAGDFKVEGGYLVNQDGHYVLDDTGREIAVASEDVYISADGTVYDAGSPVGRLGVVKVSPAGALRKVGGTLFAPSPGAEEVESEAEVLEGFLELSGVNPMVEMVNMIEALRAYEANMEMVRIQDRTLDRAVNEVGRV